MGDLMVAGTGPRRVVGPRGPPGEQPAADRGFGRGDSVAARHARSPMPSSHSAAGHSRTRRGVPAALHSVTASPRGRRRDLGATSVAADQLVVMRIAWTTAGTRCGTKRSIPSRTDHFCATTTSPRPPPRSASGSSRGGPRGPASRRGIDSATVWSPADTRATGSVPTRTTRPSEPPQTHRRSRPTNRLRLTGGRVHRVAASLATPPVVANKIVCTGAAG